MVVHEYNNWWILALTASNAIAYFSAYRFWVRKWRYEAFRLIASGTISTFYHISDSRDVDLFGIPEAGWGVLDFYLAFDTLNAMAVYIAKFEGEGQRSNRVLLRNALSLVTLILVLRDRTSVATFGVTAGLAITAIFVKFALVDRGIPKNFDYRDALLALTCVILGLVAYFLASTRGDHDPKIYAWTHSTWHIFIYLAPAFVADIYDLGRFGIIFHLRLADRRWVVQPWVSDDDPRFATNQHINRDTTASKDPEYVPLQKTTVKMDNTSGHVQTTYAQGIMAKAQHHR